MAVATGILGSATAQWPLYEITDCEIGLGPLSSADCYRSIHDYFGRELLGAGVAGGSVRYSSRDPTTISFLDRLGDNALRCSIGFLCSFQL
ncbi:hypothetical protein ACETU7_05225 [Rhodococcus sp. 3Y1]